jgi:hypothetical protein
MAKKPNNATSITVGGPKPAQNRAYAFCPAYQTTVTIGAITPFDETFSSRVSAKEARRFARYVLKLADKADYWKKKRAEDIEALKK